MTVNNLVLVIGGTGAQGSAVVAHLVKDKKYTVRVLTRNVASRQAQEVAALGNVELVQGNPTNVNDLVKAFHGVGLAYVNLDTFAIGEIAEAYWAMRIFELAVQAGTVRHFVWGGLDYVSQFVDFDPKFRCAHLDSKGRITQWLRGQPPGKLIWSALNTCAYMDMLFEFLKPNLAADGTYVFTSAIGDGFMPMISLDDLGFYARWLFDNPEKAARLDLQVATQDVTWNELAATFTRVTGKPARVENLTVDEYISRFPAAKRQSTLDPSGSGITWGENFSAWFNVYRAGLVKKDYKMLYAIHPQHQTLETWMVKNKFDGTPKNILKDYDHQK